MLSQFARAMLIIAIASVLALPVVGTAKRMYQYRDADGVMHFTDRKPVDPQLAVGIKESIVEVDQLPIVDFKLVNSDRERQVNFTNKLAGPVEVEVVLDDAVNVTSEPPAPLRAVLPPQRAVSVATIRAADPKADASYTVSYRATPGDPNAIPNLDYVYAVPLPDDSGYALHQGFGGEFSHREPQSFYAVDLAVDEGTPVLAARDGVVMHVEKDFHGAGTDDRHAGRANHVRLLHEDGSMSVYAHLQLEGATVRMGQRVQRGQVIGRSGNTGFSTGPHLHFAVQMNLSMSLESIPFRFEGLAIPGG